MFIINRVREEEVSHISIILFLIILTNIVFNIKHNIPFYNILNQYHIL